MNLTNYIKIMDMFFHEKASKNKTTRKISATDKLVAYIGSFSLANEPSAIFSASNDFYGRVVNGREKLPTPIVNLLLSNLDYEIADERLEISDLTEESKNLLIGEFEKQGVKLNYDNLPQSLASCLGGILTELIELPKKASLLSAKFDIANGVFLIGNKKYKLPYELSSIISSLTNKDNHFIDALIEVYRQDAKDEKLSLSTLSEFSPEYSAHLLIQKEAFYKAELARRRVRDCFTRDGLNEFNHFKNELYNGIKNKAIERNSNAFQRVKDTVALAISIPINTSILGTKESLIGPSERNGIVHILVNEGKIEWVVNYDTNI